MRSVPFEACCVQCCLLMSQWFTVLTSHSLHCSTLGGQLLQCFAIWETGPWVLTDFMGESTSMPDCYLYESWHGVLAWEKYPFTLKCWAPPLLLKLLLVSTPLYVCPYAFPSLSVPLPRPYTSSFSRLFSSSGGAAKKPPAEAPVNVKFNAPTSQIQPSVKKRSSTLQQLPSDKSKAFDFLNEE